MNGPERPPEGPSGRWPSRRRGERREDRPETPRSLGRSVDDYLASQGLLGMRTFGEIAVCWAEAVGEDVASHTRPRSLSGTELIVSVDHPGWATQLAFLAGTICDRLADQLGYRAVESLKAHVDARFRLD